MINQKKSGVLISYVNTVLNMFITIFLTPFLIRNLGEGEYGVYKIIASFASQLVIINFGIGTLVSRFVAKYNALNQKKAKENFLFMAMIISVAISLTIGIVGYSLVYFIEGLFGATLTSSQIVLAKKLYLIIMATTTISVFRDLFSGIMLGNERFFASKTIALGRIVLRVFLIVSLLKLGYNSIAIVSVDFALVVLIALIEVLYCFFSLNEKIKFHYWDKKDFIDCMTFSSAIVLQSIVNQVNQNIDSVILGATITKNVTYIVTLYSFALVIFNIYGNITGVISSVFTPHVTRMVVKDADSQQLTNIVIRVGRYQMMVAGAVVFGFIICGQNFLNIWVGKQYVDAYYATLLLIIPTTIPLIESVAVSILDAKMKRMVRSVVLVITAVINIICSIIFIKIFGYIGAAMGTALSIVLGHGIIMNLYYHRYIGLNIKRIFVEILRGILPSAVIATIFCVPIALWLPNSLLGFIIKAVVFMTFYGLLLYYKGMNDEEKQNTIGKISKFARKAFRRK